MGFRKRSYRRGTLTAAIAYPHESRIVLQTLSIHLLKTVLEANGVYVDIVCYELGKGCVTLDGVPVDLRKYDIVFASIHFELDYPRFVRMLIDCGLNPLREKRGPNDPLIVVGGPPVMANPEPLAIFVDLIGIGDIETIVPEIIARYPNCNRDVSCYADVPGVYVPSLGPYRIRKAWIDDLRQSVELIHDVFLGIKASGVKTVFETDVILEVMRGCMWGCRFCLDGYVMKPVRFLDIDLACQVLTRVKERYGELASKVALYGLSVTDHPRFKELLRFIVEDLGLGVSTPSINVTTIDEEALGLIAKGGQKVLTIAPETSERLRIPLGKKFTDERIIEVCTKAMKLGFTHVKLYLMVGLPGEEDGDLNEVMRLLKTLREKGVKFSISVNPWVPKPQTPLQWHPMEREDVVRRRIKELQREFKGVVSAYDYLDCIVQALLALGGRDVGGLILKAAKEGLDRGTWRRLLKANGDLIEKYVYSEKSESELPWSHIEMPIGQSILKRLYEMYLDAAYSTQPRK